MTALKDPFYYGDFKVKDIVFKGDSKYLPPLIKKNLWSKVQIMLDDKRRDTRSNNRGLDYTGTIKCGGDILDKNGKPTGEICDGSISGEVKKPHVINQELCIKCGRCLEVCKFNAVQMK